MASVCRSTELWSLFRLLPLQNTANGQCLNRAFEKKYVETNQFSTVSSTEFLRETLITEENTLHSQPLPLKIVWPSAGPLEQSLMSAWFFYINIINLGSFIHFPIQLFLIGGGIRELTPVSIGMVGSLPTCVLVSIGTYRKNRRGPNTGKRRRVWLFTRSLHIIWRLRFFFFKASLFLDISKKPFKGDLHSVAAALWLQPTGPSGPVYLSSSGVAPDVSQKPFPGSQHTFWFNSECHL